MGVPIQEKQFFPRMRSPTWIAARSVPAARHATHSIPFVALGPSQEALDTTVKHIFAYEADPDVRKILAQARHAERASAGARGSFAGRLRRRVLLGRVPTWWRGRGLRVRDVLIAARRDLSSALAGG
jgi:hypothetical protein